MANKQVQATTSALRDVSNGAQSREQDCRDVIHISVFFDGTGNNKDVDERAKKWSNVARIWRAARLFADDAKNAYPIYISGVGTPFNGKALSVKDALAIEVEDSLTGGMAGGGGTRRLDFGQQRINAALKSALLNKARSLEGQIAQYAVKGQGQSFADVNKALAKHRLIKQINVSIFGFSRGAALARAFCNEWLWECEDNRGRLLYEGYPIRFAFLGLFDTVASFGLPATNTANNVMIGGWRGRDLVVDDRVERCVHFVAGHELRFSFPVDLIRHQGKMAGNWLERVYPGVHSDIGGGYEPTEQGIDNNYARIPMRHMMNEAKACGTRLLSCADIRKVNAPIFQKVFECQPAVEAAYRDYRAACNPGGTIEHQIQEHMKQLYSAYGTLHRMGLESVTQRQHREGKSWSRLAPDDMAKELESFQRALRNSRRYSSWNVVENHYRVGQGIYAMWISPKQWQIHAWQKKAGNGVLNFVHNYVHDSKVGFLSNGEPFSYFSQRGVTESSRSVHGWFESNVARPVDQAYESTVDAAKRTKAAVERRVEQAYDATVDMANRGIERGEQVYDQAVDATSKKIEQGVQAGQRAKQAISRQTQEALKSLESAWNSIGG